MGTELYVLEEVVIDVYSLGGLQLFHLFIALALLMYGIILWLAAILVRRTNQAGF